jgi:dolichol-phosphate mannosyltransferase
MSNKLISIISPIFNEEDGIQAFLTELQKVLMPIQGYQFEILLINDGSTDNTEWIINQFAINCKTKKLVFKVFNFTRNFGHQAALLAGLEIATGEAVISLDSDLQDPPKYITSMIQEWEKGNHIVLMKRQNRGEEKRLKKIFSLTFYKLLARVSGFESNSNVGDFRLISREVQSMLLQFQKSNIYLRGAIDWLGVPAKVVFYDRQNRNAGYTKYTFTKMAKLAISGILNSGQKLLRFPIFLSTLIFILSLIISAVMIFNKVYHPEKTLPGFTSITLLIMWATTLILFSIGVLGEYIYHNNLISRGMPSYVLKPETKFVRRTSHNS